MPVLSTAGLGEDVCHEHGVSTPQRQTANLPWLGVQHLENASYNPIYCLSMPNFFPFVHSEWWMKRSKAMNDVRLHTVWYVFFDCLFNFGCDNVRNQMVLHSAF